MSPAQGYASFVIRLWYADDLEPASAISVPLRGQIIHVQSDRSGGVQSLEEIARFIEAQLSGSDREPVGGEKGVVVMEGQEASIEENLVSRSRGKDEV